jgi:ABC-type phosphate/phosphonate transport system substrate-binding protein
VKPPILVGAVIYDPKVAEIWDIIASFFRDEGCPIDYVFYSNYELQVDALLAGHIDIAWNSPLAWVDAQMRSGGSCRALAMRDTDRDRVTHLIARRGELAGVEDISGRVVATGASDSPQATLLPLHLLRLHGLDPDSDYTVRTFEVMVGKHGDHVGGELEAMRSLQRGETDACAVLDLNWERWRLDGTADPSSLESIATTEPFDHCNFTVTERFAPELESEWTDVLFRMSYDRPEHRQMMDMEGLTEWLPGRTTGYQALSDAVDEQQFFARAQKTGAR